MRVVHHDHLALVERWLVFDLQVVVGEEDQSLSLEAQSVVVDRVVVAGQVEVVVHLMGQPETQNQLEQEEDHVNDQAEQVVAGVELVVVLHVEVLMALVVVEEEVDYPRHVARIFAHEPAIYNDILIISN